MSLDNAMIYVDNIAKALSAADPANAAAMPPMPTAYKGRLLPRSARCATAIASPARKTAAGW
jgi:hypothetical protein